MAKTLVVKLAGTVDNPDLRKLGEMRIKIDPLSTVPVGFKTLSGYTQDFTFQASEPITLSLTGDGHFTDSTLTQDLGKSMSSDGGTFYVSDGHSELSILNKYAITSLTVGIGNVANQGNHHHWHVNLADFAGMSAITDIHLHWCDGYGDLSVFRENNALTSLQIINDLDRLTSSVRMTGYINSLSGLISLKTLNLFGGCHISGNISSLAGLTELQHLELTHCRYLTGDTSSIAHLHPNNGGKLAMFGYIYTGITGEWPPATA